MKILKKIVIGIGILALLLCGLIVLCAINPDIEKKLASLVPQKEETVEPALSDPEIAIEEEITARQAKEGVSENGIPAETTEEKPGASGETYEIIGPQDSAKNTSQNNNKGANGYEIPSELDVQVPTEVSGKGGYQPITENTQQLGTGSGGENNTNLGYGETGDGLTFDAAFYPYYQMLDEKGKHLYRQIYANANAVNAAFQPIESVEVSAIKDIIEAVYNDHPELFWLNTAFTCKYDSNNICAEIDLEFNDTATDLSTSLETFSNEASKILWQVEHLPSNYDKEKAVHDLLMESIDYDKSADINQSAYSALVEKKTVCAGYARAMQYLLQRLGIPCYYCTGYAGEDHAWNIVQLDDGYYNVDVTWDDTPGGEYDYFNRSDADFKTTHVRKSLSVNLPVCDGQKYRDPGQ